MRRPYLLMVIMECLLFIPYLYLELIWTAWMSLFDKDVSVILVDWHNLASFTGVNICYITPFMFD